LETRQLQSRIATLRRQVRRLLAFYGLGWVVGLTVPLVILAGLGDWMIHLDAGVRLTLLIALAGFAGWLFYRYTLLPLIVRFGDLDIALRIEERWPGLNDRLASTVQFLKIRGDDDRFGSSLMRQETVRRTLEETRSIDFRQAIEPKPTLRALAAGAGAILLLLSVVAAEPGLSGIAARRLFLPFGKDQWPQQTHLALLEKETPRKIARGEPFSLAVAVAPGDRIPSSARATYRFDDGETLTEALRSVEGGIFRGRIETVERSFRFSVVAGDDSTSVRDVAVKVIPPPVIKDLVVRLVAPEYTKLAPQTLAPGKTQIKAVEGTRVELDALANKPIEVAALKLGEKVAGEAVKLDKARTHLKAKFTLSESAPFWFELLDTEGFRSREVTRYDARAIRDEAPRVVIDEPINDRDVPAAAAVPVEFTVDDDYGIHAARLVYRAASGGSEPTQEVVLPLWDAGDSSDGKPVKHQQVKHTWDLAPLKLPPGSVITFHAEARDFDSIKGPNLGKSRDLRLRIVTDEEIGRQFDDARRAIREDVENILAMQNQARTPVNEAIRTLSQTDRLSQPGRENLKNAEMIQRQVGNRITSKADGLDQKIGRFLDDLKNFKLPNPDAQKQMEEMRAGVARIRENHLEPAEQGLTRASKQIDESAGTQSSRPSQQDATKGDLAQQAGAQSKAQAKAESSGSTQAAARANAPAQERQQAQPKADASKESNAANEQAGETAKAAARPPAGENEKPQGPSEKPLDLAKESLAEAQTNQKAIADELKKMLDDLGEFETYRGVVKDAQNLLKEHEQVMKQSSEAAGRPDMMGKTPDQLTPEQKADLGNLSGRQSNVARGLQNLQEKMQDMAKRLGESDPLAASAMKEAADQVNKKGTTAKVGEAADQLEKNQMGAARTSQDQARQDLKDLVDSIQNRRERELARLVRELKNAEAELAKLHQRQTQNLAKTRAAQKNPDAKERANELKRLAKEQAEIQKGLENQLKRLAKLNAESAARAAARASGKMGQAQQDLDQGQGDQAGKNEDDALADLEDAQDETKQARKEAEERLAIEQLAKMGDQLKSLSERQEKLVGDTAEYEKLRFQREGKLTIAQRTGIRNLAGVEEALKDETVELKDKLEGAPVFALTLKRATQGMDTAAQRLQTLKTDDETQRAASSAAGRFKQLIDALKPDAPKPGDKQQGGGDGGGGGGGGGGDGIPPAAQLKMLKALQEEINERTEYFDELKRRGKELTPEQAKELDRLQTDQGTLADLVRDLTKPKSDDQED
jgi:hypothetical protein